MEQMNEKIGRFRYCLILYYAEGRLIYGTNE